MMRVTTLYASTASATAQYYTRYLTQADGEQPGQWSGPSGRPARPRRSGDDRAARSVVGGPRPGLGVTVGEPARGPRHIVGEGGAGGRRVRRDVVGTEVVVGVVGTHWRRRLAACHDVAVAAVVDMVERYGSTTRVRSNGHRLHPDSQGLTCAVFRQTTSRLDDPQLHSHVVISAKVQTDDGRWLALDARVLKGFQRALGGLYQSVLRAELTARYGVVFGEIVNGQAEIAGVPSRAPRRVLETQQRSRRPRSRPSSLSSGLVRGGIRHRKNAARSAAKPPRTPAVTRPATASPICGHGGSTKPPPSASHRHRCTTSIQRSRPSAAGAAAGRDRRRDRRGWRSAVGVASPRRAPSHL